MPGQLKFWHFMPALLLAVILRFLLGLLAGAACLLDGACQRAADAAGCVDLLAGRSGCAGALLPEILQTAAQVLPFRYMVSFPVEMLTGQLTQAQLLTGFAVQTAWVAVALILTASFGKQEFAASVR
jgi:ABC-2 type transport system permease protein